MPHKFNTSRRHKFAKKKYRVTNWCGYNEGAYILKTIANEVKYD